MPKSKQSQKSPIAQTDEAFKIAIELCFEPMIQFFLPELHQAVQWQYPPQFLDKELQKIHPKNQTRKRYADKLVKVLLLNGQEQFLLIHVETQAQRDDLFARRMWEYFYRISDQNAHSPVISVALLADDHPEWRPTTYEYAMFGTELQFKFLSLKLLDYADTSASDVFQDNPFAWIVQAHLQAQATRHQMETRQQEKFRLVRRLLAQPGYNMEAVRGLLGLLDYLMGLPPALELAYEQQVLEWIAMPETPLISGIERHLMERGRREGLTEGSVGATRQALLQVVQARFHHAPRSLENQLNQVTDLARLQALLREAAVANSLEEFIQTFEQTKN